MILRLTLCVVLTLIVSAPADAQCPINQIGFQSYGQGCNGFLPPQLSGSFDPGSCSLTLVNPGMSNLGNTFPLRRFWIFGLQPANYPLTFLGPSCVSLTSADLIEVRAASLGNTATFVMPPWFFPGLQIYAQGATEYFATIGQGFVQFTDGLQMTMQ